MSFHPVIVWFALPPGYRIKSLSTMKEDTFFTQILPIHPVISIIHRKQPFLSKISNYKFCSHRTGCLTIYWNLHLLNLGNTFHVKSPSYGCAVNGWQLALMVGERLAGGYPPSISWSTRWQIYSHWHEVYLSAEDWDTDGKTKQTLSSNQWILPGKVSQVHWSSPLVQTRERWTRLYSNWFVFLLRN